MAHLIRQLEGSGADVKWVAPVHLHLTLKFLGDVTDDQRRAIEQALRGVAEREQPFRMALAEVGAFPSVTAPRVVWVGVGAGQREAERIAMGIDEAAAAAGIPKEAREFAAHVTIGRVRTPRGRKELSAALGAAAWTAPPAWTAAGITLYQSQLSSTGPAYTPLAEIPFTT